MANILIFIPVFFPHTQFGGPVFSTYRLAKGLQENGCNVVVLTTTNGKNDLLLEDEYDGIKIIRIKSVLLKGLIIPLEFKSFDIIKDFDYINTSSIWHPISLFITYYSKKYKKKLIVSGRGALGQYSFSSKRIKKIIYLKLFESYNLNNAYCFHSSSSMEDGESCFYLKDYVKRFIVYNSIYCSSNICRTQVLDYKYIIFSGRLHPKKGLDFLLSVLQKVKSFNGYKILFVGNDECGYKSKIYSLLGFENVVLLGNIPFDVLLNYYYNAEFLILPSLHENYGNVVVESLMCSTPVIVSEFVGSKDIVNDVDGGMVLPLNCDIWCEILTQIFEESLNKIDFNINKTKLYTLCDYKINSKMFLKFIQDVHCCDFDEK